MRYTENKKQPDQTKKFEDEEMKNMMLSILEINARKIGRIIKCWSINNFRALNLLWNDSERLKLDVARVEAKTLCFKDTEGSVKAHYHNRWGKKCLLLQTQIITI